MSEVEWVMRHGTPTVHERMMAASIIAAYQQMIKDPQKKRNYIVSELRKGSGPNKPVDLTPRK